MWRIIRKISKSVAVVIVALGIMLSGFPSSLLLDRLAQAAQDKNVVDKLYLAAKDKNVIDKGITRLLKPRVEAAQAADKKSAPDEKFADMPRLEVAKENMFRAQRKDFQINEDPVFEIRNNISESAKDEAALPFGKLMADEKPASDVSQNNSVENFLSGTAEPVQDAFGELAAPFKSDAENVSDSGEEKTIGANASGEDVNSSENTATEAGEKKSNGAGSERAVQAAVLDGSGQETDIAPLVEESNGATRVRVPALKNAFRPGKYQLKVEVAKNGKVLTSTQDFTWGVLAINANKSIYSPGETAKLAIGVLDENGSMICDAKLALEIKDSQDEAKILSTDDGEIKVNRDVCVSRAFTLEPDYEAKYKVGGWGKYEMTLTAETANGTYAIKDSFEVSNLIPFDVERKTATRINPKNVYPVTFEISANEDFSGEIQERTPVSFEVSKGDEKDFVSFDKEKTKDKEKILIWDVSLKKGEKISLGYQFDAPDESPQFYLLGPLQFKEKDKVIFEEVRQWQIASDDPPSYAMQTGYYTGNGDTTTISGLGFAPELIIIKSNSNAGTGAVFKTTAMLKSSFAYMNGVATADDAAGVINLEPDGFEVTGTAYNTANARYNWEAFAGSDCTASGRFCVGTYYGSGSNPRLVTPPVSSRISCGSRPPRPETPPIGAPPRPRTMAPSSSAPP